jgi:putative exosortase-associated protein (TIGR04073 family)
VRTDSAAVTQVQIPAAPTARIETGAGTSTQIVTPAAPSPQFAINVEEQEWGPADKLMRGVGNLFLGFIELPRNIFNTTQEENILAGLTLGTFKGIGYTAVRMGAGAYDTLTFFVPLPEGYRPLIEPEYPWQEPGPEFLG